MFRRDYILHQIEEFGRVLAAIMGLRREKKFDEAQQKIDHAYKNILKLSSDFAKNHTTDEILDVLKNEKGMDNQMIRMVAELLYEEGLTLHDRQDDQEMMRITLERANVLFNYLMNADTVFSFDWYEKQNKIQELLQKPD